VRRGSDCVATSRVKPLKSSSLTKPDSGGADQQRSEHRITRRQAFDYQIRNIPSTSPVWCCAAIANILNRILASKAAGEEAGSFHQPFEAAGQAADRHHGAGNGADGFAVGGRCRGW